MKKQLKPRIKSMNRIVIIVVVLGLLVSLGLYLRSIMVSPQVAEIGNTVSSNCQTNIATISFHDECDEIGTFKRSVYTCANGSTAEKLTNLNCISSEAIFMEAQNNCGQTCLSPSITPSTSPMPSASPTPYPSVVTTADPSTGPITCNLKTYKRPAGMDGWSESQVINPAGATINPGEQLAYAVELVNPNKHSMGGPLKLYTTNLNGENEPVNVKSWGGLCKISSGGRTISCYEDKFQIDANSTRGLPSMTIVLEILSSEQTQIRNTGIFFSGSLGATEFRCDPTTYLTINNTKPTSTPTPTPRACAQEMGSCTTKQGTCLTYTDSCAKTDFCAVPLKLCKAPVTPSPIFTKSAPRRCLKIFNRQICLPTLRP